MPKTKKVEEVKLDLEHTLLVDNAFTVDRARWGTFRSFDPEGKALVTSPTEEACVEATRFYLKARQEGFTEIATSYTGHVDGKL